MLKISNNTRWASRPMRSVIARLSNRLGRREPRTLNIAELRSRSLDYGYHRGQGIATVYVPTKNISPFWFARVIDDMLKDFTGGQTRYTHDPRDLRLNNQVMREYEWAKEFNLIPPPKPKPTLLEKKIARVKAIDKLGYNWNQRITAAEKEIRRANNAKQKLAKERKRLLKDITKLTAEKESDNE